MPTPEASAGEKDNEEGGEKDKEQGGEKESADATEGSPGSAQEKAAPEGDVVWALLPVDTKFDEGLKKNAAATLQRLVWMKALGELASPVASGGAGAEEAEAKSGQRQRRSPPTLNVRRRAD